MVCVAIRVDATAALGWGHLKRCMALATALQRQGVEPVFCGRSEGEAATLQLATQGWEWLPVAASTAELDELADATAFLAAQPRRPDVVVVDHYALGATWHRSVRDALGAPIVVIDDLADRGLAPDLLVDPNPSEDHALKYRDVLPVGVPLCGGPTWSLLDPVYLSRHVTPVSAEVRRVGIFMGGTDPQDHSTWVLGLLRGALAWRGEICIATTSANPHLPSLRRLAQQCGAQLHLDLPHLADFHAGCDVQVGAGGGALWERCCLGVPTLALICADNQCQTVPALVREQVILGLDGRGKTPAQATALVQALRSLLQDALLRQSLQRRAMQCVDGLGAGRLAGRILALLDPSPALSLRRANLDDAPFLLDWRNDPATRSASHDGAVVLPVDHRDWLARCLADPQRRLWVACLGPVPVGTVRADRDDTAGTTTLSWTVSPRQRGSGIGRAMVALAAGQLNGRLLAKVKRGNQASARIAQSLGMALVLEEGETLHFERPGRGLLLD